MRQEDEVVWADSRRELTEKYPGTLPKSVTFIPASVYDNKILLKKDPGYLANLLALDYLEQERVLHGNWKVRPGAGKLYNRGWYEIVREVPAGGIVIRFFDFAATKKSLTKADPDYTASVLMKLVDGTYYIMDCQAQQLAPTASESMMINTVVQDVQQARRLGYSYMVRWEEEPGSAAKRDSIRLIKALTKKVAGINARGVLSRVDKVTRGKAFSSQSEAGNVKLKADRWNEEWLTHMHHQPEFSHDDIADASTGAFNALENQGWARGSN